MGTKRQAGTRKITEFTKRRKQIAADYLRGATQIELAAKYEIDKATVSRDLAAIRAEWQQSALLDFHAAMAEQLARIDTLEAEYWGAWEDSRLERTETRSGKTENLGMNGDGPHPTRSATVASIRRVSRDGNPAFLQGVQWCIEQRCKILGVYAPVKGELAGPNGAPATFRVVYENRRRIHDPAA